MHVLIHPDSIVAAPRANTSRLAARFYSVVSRYGHRLSDVQVELIDETSERATGNDMGCRARCRVDGRTPIAVVHHASTVEEAVGGAARQLDQLVDSLVENPYDEAGQESSGRF